MITPSEFYRQRRPEYFSDSSFKHECTLSREVFAFELSKVSTYQKQDNFETLCRRLAEKLITPNLIPQVGPTGGGDGKTDSETYPVSDEISERWFVPDNGWEKDEKWAFAFSAKADWRGKVRTDVKKIVATEREYNRIYFISNQLIPSKNRKNAQDVLSKEFNIDLTILDGQWIIDKLFDNNLILIAVEALNLSDEYRQRVRKIGSNDTQREQELDEIEQKITNSKRYFKYDHQLVEDALHAAILSRMLEKPRFEVEGRFDRALRLSTEVGNLNQQLEIHYQRAWTYINWYDDFEQFLGEYKKYRDKFKIISIRNVEQLQTLFMLIHGLSRNGIVELNQFGIEYDDERKFYTQQLEMIVETKEGTCIEHLSRTYLQLHSLLDAIDKSEDSSNCIGRLTDLLKDSTKYLGYPFNGIFKLIVELGALLPASRAYDEMVDVIASLTETRSSEIASGKQFLIRGQQKLDSKRSKDAITFYGKAVAKLSKFETQDVMWHAYIGLGIAYQEQGLIWASGTCFITALSISLADWYRENHISKYAVMSARYIVMNEICIGRFAVFLAWHELLHILSQQIETVEKHLENHTYIDSCLACRILNCTPDETTSIGVLPDLLGINEFYIAEGACLFKLGQSAEVLSKEKKTGYLTELTPTEYFGMLRGQPLSDHFCSHSQTEDASLVEYHTSLLGLKVSVVCEQGSIEHQLAAETILAVLESFFATSAAEVFPLSEHIRIIVENDSAVESFEIESSSSRAKYILRINTFYFADEHIGGEWDKINEFIARVLTDHFHLPDYEAYLEKLFLQDDVTGRMMHTLNHAKQIRYSLGNKIKFLLSDWMREESTSEYENLNTDVFQSPVDTPKWDIPMPNIEDTPHSMMKVQTVIDAKLWDRAKWKAFGVFGDEHGIGACLVFENEEVGISIFEEWRERIGLVDKDELIRVSIIRGVSKTHPHWYRVHLTINRNALQFKPGLRITTISRYMEACPKTPEHLNKLERGYLQYGTYRFCPSKFSEIAQGIVPLTKYAILKKSLEFREAWQIGKNDVDSVAVSNLTEPIVPGKLDKDKIPIFDIINDI